MVDSNFRAQQMGSTEFELFSFVLCLLTNYMRYDFKKFGNFLYQIVANFLLNANETVSVLKN